MRDQGVDTDTLEKKLIDTVRDIYLKNEHEIIEATKKFPNKRSFFELHRSDFLLDENLDIHFMEVNRHPSMSPYGKNGRHTLLYEQVSSY